MLIISRKVGERFLIGDSIVIMITGISGNAVRLGIEAPPDVRILRNELLPPEPTEGEVGESGKDCE